MAKKAKPAGPRLDENGFPLTVDTKGLALVTGVSETRINQLVRDNRISGAARAGLGRWHTSKALIELFAYYRRQADKSRPKTAALIEEQQALENLRKIRIANARQSGKLLPSTMYREIWGELITVWKQRFLAFPHKMGPRVFRAKDKVEAAEQLEAEIRDIFRALEDPKVMQLVEAQIRDDEFSTDGRPTHDAGGGGSDSPGHLVPEDA